MPVPYGGRGGYRATFTDGVLEHAFTADFTGQAPHPVVLEHTERGHRAGLRARHPGVVITQVEPVQTIDGTATIAGFL